MDILAHALWASAGITVARRRWPVSGRTAALAVALAGWWSHIVIDVFTHSADYYPVPVLYPFTYRSFDGIAWNTPWFLALNYAALAATGFWLWLSRRRAGKAGPESQTAGGSLPRPPG